MTLMNRLGVAGNPYQGDIKRVLTVCSGGVLRSPTAAEVLHQQYGYNTRSAGLNEDFALIIVDEVLIAWAQEIVCMTEEHVAALLVKFDATSKDLVNLRIQDNYAFRDPELIDLIKERYASAIKIRELPSNG